MPGRPGGNLGGNRPASPGILWFIIPPGNPGGMPGMCGGGMPEGIKQLQ